MPLSSTESYQLEQQKFLLFPLVCLWFLYSGFRMGNCDTRWRPPINPVIPWGSTVCWRARFQSSAVEMESTRIPGSLQFVARKGGGGGRRQACSRPDLQLWRQKGWMLLQIPSFSMLNEIMSRLLRYINKTFGNNGSNRQLFPCSC
jgi:hypothetical protein